MLMSDCSVYGFQLWVWINCICVEDILNAAQRLFLLIFGMLKVLQWEISKPPLFFFCSSCDVLQNSQLSKVTDEDDNRDGSSELGLDSSQQARVAQSLQAHDYVRLSQSFSDGRLAHINNRFIQQRPASFLYYRQERW